MTLPDLLAPSLQAAIAAELRRIRASLEGLAEVLVGDPHFVTTYLDQLQAFDLLIQSADESASVLDRLAAGMLAHDAVAPVRLGAVQQRLRSAIDAPQAA